MEYKNVFQKALNSIFFNTLIRKWDAVVVSLVSIIYGMILFRNPNIIEQGKVYEELSRIFTGTFFGFLFMFFGSMKILSIIFDRKWLKIISISLLVGIWVLFGSALFQNSTVNTLYIHSFGWALISFGVVIREWVD